MESTSDRRLLVGALAVLVAATGIAFGRVFVGTHPTVRLTAAGIAAIAIAAALARRPILLSIAASAAGLLVALGLLVFPETTWFGVPMPETVGAVVRALSRAGERATNEIAPAPPLPALMAAATIAIWSAATSAHALAVRAGAAVLPLLPPAALLAFAGVATQEPPRPGYVVLFLVGCFAVLFAEAVRGAGGWSGSRSRSAVSGRWARVMGVVAGIVAIAAPGLLPGFGDEALVPIAGSSGRVEVNPIVDIRPSLLQNPAANLFSVRAERPAYWRMLVLDRFDGRLWTSGDLDISEGSDIDGGAILRSTLSSQAASLLDQEFVIDDLATPWLPAAADPIQVELGGLGGRFDGDRGVLALESETADGLRYRVRSATPTPKPRALGESDPATAVRPLVGQPLVSERYVELPAGLSPRIREIALDVTARAETPFEAMLAIQDHLRTFRYDERAPAGHGNDAIVHFLEVTRTGYCEQFAGTMAVLARALGHPARVAIGFLPGELADDGTYRVTTQHVHAWPEVFFPPYGWLAFEPTPTRANPTARYLAGVPGGGRAGRERGREARDRQGSGTGAEARESFRLAPEPAAPGSFRDDQRRGRSGWWTLAMLALALAVVAGLLIPPTKALIRRISLTRARTPAERVLAAYGWVLGGAADLGVGRRPGETMWEYRSRLRARAPLGEELDRLTGLAGRATYSVREVDDAQADDALMSARSLLRDLRRDAGPMRTVVGAFRPTS